MKVPALLTDARLNVRSFHQMKTLCLVALIVSHCLSFAAMTLQRPVSELKFAAGVSFLTTLNGLFIFMTGVTLRLSLADRIKGDHLRAGSWVGTTDMLFLLLVIETLKNNVLYGVAHALEWDFLKTIL